LDLRYEAKFSEIDEQEELESEAKQLNFQRKNSINAAIATTPLFLL
jgi:hypothetical protein